MIEAGGGPVIQCPQCYQENPPQVNFCLACGVRLTLTCGACGTALPVGARFCLACGQLVQSPDTIQPRPAAPVVYTPQHLPENLCTISERSGFTKFPGVGKAHIANLRMPDVPALSP